MKRSFLYCSILLLVSLILCPVVMAQWTAPVPLAEVNTQYSDASPFLSYDGLTLYFTRRETNTYYHNRIYEATREQSTGPFTSIRELSELNSSGANVIWPWVSPDNLRMYYSKSVARLIFSQRGSVHDIWPRGSDITELNALGKIYDPSLTADELIIVFHSPYLPGSVGNDIWMAERTDRTSPFGNARSVTEINTASHESGAFISPDGLTLFFASNRNGPWQILKATRVSTEDAFGNVEHMPIFDIPGGSSSAPSISSDGRTFYFVGVADGGIADIWVSNLISRQVEIDIKPGSCPNPLNLFSRGVLPVAILGGEDFDVNSIDIATLRLAGAAPVRSNFEDVAGPGIDANDCDCNTIGPDGYADMVLKFKTQDVVEQIHSELDGDLVKDDWLELMLTGQLYDQTPIEGADCVVIVGKVPQSLAARKADINKDGRVDNFDFATLSEYWLQPAAKDY